MVLLASLLLAAGALMLAGCGDPAAQTASSGAKADAHVSAGTDKPPPYMVTGWKPGDRAAWEQHMKARTQGGQDEYPKIR